MRNNKVLVTASAVVLSVLTLAAGARAASGTFTATASGSFTTIPLDTNDSSCILTGGTTTCPALSVETNAVATSSGFLRGTFNQQAVLESTPVAGTGCLIDPSIASCTLGTSTNACAYTYASGGSFVERESVSGALLYGSFNPGGTTCIDYNTFPFNFSNAGGGNITGGTGKGTGFKGTFTFSSTGQILNLDLQGHQFGWVNQTITGVVTTP